MADFDIKVNGLAEVQRALFAFSNKLGEKVVIDSLKQGARVISREAKRRAPKRTGRVRRAIVVKKSKINSLRRTGNRAGVYITLRKGKGKSDPKDGFYGRFIEDGWNTHGKRNAARYEITSVFGGRTGRKTGPGRRNVPGREFIKGAFLAKRNEAVRLAALSAERGAKVISRRLGLNA